MKILYGCPVFSARSGNGRRTVTLRRVTHDHSYDAAGQNNLEIVAVLQIGDEKGQDEPDSQTEKYAERHGLHLASENTCRDAGDQSLDRRTKDNSNYLRADGRCKPGRPSVDCAEKSSYEKSQQHFIHSIPPPLSVSLLFPTTNLGIPLRLAVHEKQNQNAHGQVGCNQQDKETVAAVESRGFLKNALFVGANGKAIEVSRNVQGHLLNVRIAASRQVRGRLRANGGEGFIEAWATRLGSWFWVAGDQELQERAKRKDVAAGVQMLDVAAGLLRGHVARRAHHGAVPGDDRNFGGLAGSGELFWLFENSGFRIIFAGSARNFAAQDFGETPVHHQNFAEGADHDIRGL